MLTGKAKIGYILVDCGVVLLIPTLVSAFTGELDGLDVTISLAATTLVVIGSALLRQDPTARSLGWRLYWSQVQVLQPGRDKVASLLVVVGTVLLTVPIRKLWEGGSFAAEWKYFVAILLALAMGWYLALSEFLPSRSPEK